MIYATHFIECSVCNPATTQTNILLLVVRQITLQSDSVPCKRKEHQRWLRSTVSEAGGH